MIKRQRQDFEGESPRKKGSHSRIGRACDRCQHRKLACDPTEHSCQQCQKANTWCTTTDSLSGIPAYRGQYEYLERRVEKQHREIQDLLCRLRNLGQDVAGFNSQDNETIRYSAWKHARYLEPSRPWEKEDKQANYTRDLVLQDEHLGSPLSQQSRNLVNSSTSSPELKSSGAFDALLQPTRSHRSSSIYSAPPQLSSPAMGMPSKRMRQGSDNVTCYSQSLAAGILEGFQMSNSIQGPQTHSGGASSPGTVSRTIDSLRVLSHEDSQAGPVYAPDGSTWYSYTNESGGVPNFPPPRSMMPQETNLYTLATSVGYQSGISAHQFPMVVINSQSES